jgi:hypothetical protein
MTEKQRTVHQLQEIKGADRALDRVSGMSNQGFRVNSNGLAARVSSRTFLLSKARE